VLENNNMRFVENLIEIIKEMPQLLEDLLVYESMGRKIGKKKLKSFLS